MTKRMRHRTAASAALLIGTAAACAGPPNPEEGSERDSGPALGRRRRTSQPRAFTLVASGDVLPHASVIERANTDAGGNGYDFRPMLAGVQPVVSGADLAICHMETVYGADGGPYTGYPTFKSPPRGGRGRSRATGYDACSTASNHTLDDGAAGIRRTLDALDRAGVRHAGSARTAAEAGRHRSAAGGRRQGRPSRVHLRHERHPAARRASPGPST